jgi:uncharacterized protein
MSSWTITREELEREIDAHRLARVARLTAERGWLTLVGKVWLHEGRHVIGADPGSDIVLPRDRSPARLGTVTLADGVVRLEVEAEVDAFAGGQRVRTLDLHANAGPADDVTVGSITLQLVERRGEFALRIRDSESAVRRHFPGIPAYPVDPTWRLAARLDAFDVPREMAIEDGDGRPQTYLCPGIAHFERQGQAATLLPVFEHGDGRLFVIFSDLTNRDTTYGAGRFLYAPPPDAGHVLLDFNKAFNPPCAFTPYAVCPLPPPENKLLLRIEAGEKRPSLP